MVVSGGLNNGRVEGGLDGGKGIHEKMSDKSEKVK